MNTQTQNYYRFQTNREARAKWPIAFWAILKVLGIFLYRSVVTKRKCYRCHVKNIREAVSLGRLSIPRLDFDHLNLEYELNLEEEFCVGLSECAEEIYQMNEKCEV